VTPVPLDLPLRPAEAAELANLIFEHAERKALTDEVRNRLAARAAVLKLESITPYFGSLEKDPVHPSAYYLAVDGLLGSRQLLYMASAAAPTSSIFHKPLLIGRMRRVNGPELVINATPFGPADRRHIEMFAEKIDSSFLPKPQGARAEIALTDDGPAGFDTFRAIFKRTGKNLAAFAGDYHAGLWAAIRSGWRQGYAAIVELPPGSNAGSIRPHLAYTRFAVDVSEIVPLEPALKAAEAVHEQIRQARAVMRVSGPFEFQVGLGDASAADLGSALEWLKTRGHAAQFIAPARITGSLEEAADTVRQQQAMLSLRYRGEPGENIDAVARATLGRVSYRVVNAEEAAMVAEHLLG
jgi:hypothetical protein